MWPAILAVAATITIGALLVLPRFEHRPRPEAVLKLGPQRVALEDGSLMELNAHALAELRFTPADRHVRLLQGEAHFVVAHDPLRPFVVTAESFSVRALGTAFALRFDHESLSVLVTEGRIQLDETRSATATLQNRHELSRVAAGQKATVRTGGAEGVAPALTLQELSSAEIDQALAWQTLRLEFNDLPLRDVVAEFNRFNHRKLVIGDRVTGDILVGGSFRPDRIESFVRVLELGFGVKPELREHEILLSRGP
jgi:transmembrane sensor